MSDKGKADQESTPWFVYSGPVFEFAGVLRDADIMPYDEDEYWAKPHHWDDEHSLWIDAGSPRCPEAGEPPSLGWQRFIRATEEDRDDD